MAEGAITYIHPAWGLVPLEHHKSHAVHVQVKFDEDSTLPVAVVHNLNLPYGAPLQPPEWHMPLVIVNPISGGPNAPLHTVAIMDGNSLDIGRVAGGPGTAVAYDVWILRHKPDSAWF